jgi:transposase InsO family protein
MALGREMRRGRRPGVHHSDEAVQYAATAYTNLLAGRGVAISMAAVGKPEENGYAERLMRTVKEEEVDLSEYRRHLGIFAARIAELVTQLVSTGDLAPCSCADVVHL